MQPITKNQFILREISYIIGKVFSSILYVLCIHINMLKKMFTQILPLKGKSNTKLGLQQCIIAPAVSVQ